ncbi:hypothetical protein GCM10022267_24830 [Lentzea roselyniae]|uniref:Uncharacterized protein n=1 Tax=Lentzea roselyniae TaxID=531940 RepID=A0ABP7AQ89_9PSEU
MRTPGWGDPAQGGTVRRADQLGWRNREKPDVRKASVRAIGVAAETPRHNGLTTILSLARVIANRISVQVFHVPCNGVRHRPTKSN